MFRRYGIVLVLFLNLSLLADEPNTDSGLPQQQDEAAQTGPLEPSTFELSDEVRDVLVPLFSAIAKADASRATVQMLVDSVLNGQVIESQESTFQIASVHPDKFTVYLKEPDQRTRIYCDGESLAVALAPDAYFRLPEPLQMQAAVTDLPVPMGPYPEPVLALTLAGVDPAISLIAGMKSLEIVDRKDFRGLPAVHLRGVQADAVSWDFWISREEQPKPLRLLVDLTPMLIESGELQVPAGFSYQVRFDFLSWRVSGDVDKSLFVYQPAAEAKQYESLEDYYESMAGVVAEHPLLGKPSPSFKTETLAGTEVDSKQLADKVVVIDFWATWCAPCVAAMPIIQEVCGKFADKDVVFLALNTGEDKETIDAFLKEQKLSIDACLDPDGKIADAFMADAIPQTIVIGKSGSVESVHVGFAGAEALTQRLTDELEVLHVGGRIGSVQSKSDSPPQSTDEPGQPEVTSP